MSQRRIHPLDFSVASSRIMTVLGPTNLPSVDAIRAMLATLAFHDKARVGLSPRTGLWWERTGFDPHSVTSRTIDGPVDPARLATEFARDTPAPPIRVQIVNNEWLLLDYCHGYSDGLLAGLLTYWLAAGDSAAPAPDLITGQQLRIPLTRAGFGLLRQRTSGPRQLADARRLSCPPVAAPETGVSWAPRPTVAVTATSSEDWQQLRALRAAHPGEVSTASIIKALCVRALERAGVTVDPRVQFTFDLRRYLGPQIYTGYLISAITYPMDNPTNPEEYHRLTQSAVASGHPIAQAALASTKVATALATAKARGVPAVPSPIAVAPETPQPVALTFSDVGPLPLLDEVEYTVPPGVGINANIPALPHGINLSYYIFGDRLRVTMTFHDNIVDPQAIARARELIATQSPQLAAESLTGSGAPQC